jgi:UDP-glucose 4-epimerase
MKKIYAVIGGAGFIGHHIVNRLIDNGHDVIVIDNLSTGIRENINPKAVFYQLDISQDDITDILKGAHVVILTAAMARVQPSIKDPITYNKTNVEGILRVLHSCHLAGVQRVVYSASSSAYGDTDIFPTPETTTTNPLSPYGLQKYIGEQYCKLYSQLYKLDTVSLRYFNVYGEGMPIAGAYRTVLSIFGEQYKKGLPLSFTNDGEQRRDFTYVQDVVSANLLAAEYEHPLNGEVFNVGNGHNYSVNEVIDMFGSESIFLEERIEPKTTLADNSKLRKTFGWKPTGDLPKFIEQYKKTLR